MSGEATTTAGRYATTVREDAAGHPATDTLRIRYQGYVLRQGRDLLALLPREGVRDLVRAYRARPDGSTALTQPLLEDLAAFAATLLPLPPFGVWLEDFSRHRAAHLEQSEPPLADGPAAPGGESVTVDVRSFAMAGQEWMGELRVRPVPEGWRGSVLFHRPGAEKAGCTGEIFRERDLTALRERFDACDGVTLQAFLRSTLP
jgi:hypothetical protein